MNILIYKEGTALSELDGRKLKSNTKPFLSFDYDELYYTQMRRSYIYNYEEKELSKEQIQEIEAFIGQIQENKDLSIMRSLQNYLQQTDWMVIRELETQKKMPQHIKEERARAREKLHDLKS